MNTRTIETVKNTLVVILKTRDRPQTVGVALAARWDVRLATHPYAKDHDYEVNLYLPPQAYAVIGSNDRECFVTEIFETMNEIMVPMCERVFSVRIVPELVEALTYSQEALIRWWQDQANVNDAVFEEAPRLSAGDDDGIPF